MCHGVLLSILLGVLLGVLLGLLGSASCLLPPRISSPLNSADRPLVHFHLPGVHNTTTLLLSDNGSILYVGARDAVLSLDVSQRDVISLKNKAEWKPTQKETEECQIKGKDEKTDCPNFIRVLQPINSTHLYACGSYAYNPHDTYMDAESLSMVPISSKRNTEAKGRCPFNPFQRNSAIAIDGELFTGTTSDFRGGKPQIARHFSQDGRPDVSQDSSVSLLQEPTFISSSFDPGEGKLYFFFSEVGKEYSFVDELRVARVAQVCKDDVGGQRTLQKRWTSFAKAPLLCQHQKQLPFNILQDTFTLRPADGDNSKDTLFYGIFTSQWSMGSDSAVCVFRLKDVRTVFTGSYKTFNMETHQWSQLQGKHAFLGQCGLGNASDADLEEVKKSFLTNEGVKPVGGVPVVVSTDQRYSRVAAMRTQAASGKEYTILFLLTESGFLHKVLLDQGPRVIEEVQVFTQPQLVKTIILSSSKGVIYVGTSEGVTEVPVANCPAYRTCTQCVLARDPFCGWDHTRRVCTSLNNRSSNIGQDVENGNVTEECPEPANADPAPVETFTYLNEAVRLPCRKPSNLATLKWTSPRFRILPENLFIQSADGSLVFLATSGTLGSYHCISEEGGYQEIVASHTVRQTAPPRSMGPPPTLIHHNTVTDTHRKTSANLPENTGTEEPPTSMREPPVNPEESLRDPVSINKDDTIHNQEAKGFQPYTFDYDFDFTTMISATVDTRARKDDVTNSNQTMKEKSYYSELVVVSLLLAVCGCLLILGGLVWRHRGLKPSPLVGASEEDGKATGSLYLYTGITSLSADDSGPDFT
ncbi:semaphorin-4A-like [Diretmus argenteus]